MPLHLYEGLSGRLITTILTAKRFTGAQRLSLLTRLVKDLRQAWPDTLLILRGDRHFASPEVMPWSDEHPEVPSVTGLTRKAVLKELAGEVVEQARRASAYSGRKVTRFHSTRSQAQTWSRARRVVIKVAVTEHGVNTRCVVTDREPARPQVLSQHIDCARGHADHALNDHKLDLTSDRTACHRFEANQFRLLVHAAAYVFLETLRREGCRTTQGASATMEGNDPVTLMHTWRPCARMQGADAEIVPLVMPGGAGFETHCGVVGVRAVDGVGPLS